MMGGGVCFFEEGRVSPFGSVWRVVVKWESLPGG